MRLLIDECVDERLRLLFPDHDCQTARFAGLAGLKNGRLLEAAEAAGFDVLITVDQNIPDQQNLTGRGISLIILCGPTNRLCDLEPLGSGCDRRPGINLSRQCRENRVDGSGGRPLEVSATGGPKCRHEDDNPRAVIAEHVVKPCDILDLDAFDVGCVGYRKIR